MASYTTSGDTILCGRSEIWKAVVKERRVEGRAVFWRVPLERHVRRLKSHTSGYVLAEQNEPSHGLHHSA